MHLDLGKIYTLEIDLDLDLIRLI